MIPHIKDTRDELAESDIFYSYEKLNNIKWYDRILLNRPTKVVVIFIALAIVAPLLLYRFYFFASLNLPPADGFSIGSCLVPREMRLFCGVGLMPQEECHPHCCYDLNLKLCYHRIPSRFSYIIDQPWNEDIILHPRIATVPFGNQDSTTKLKLSIDEESTTHMVLTFYNARNVSLRGKRLDMKDYSYEVSSPEINVIVNATQGTIFNSFRGPLIASNNIWEISFKLTNETMYGLGDIPLRRNTTKVIYSHDGDLSSIPLIFAKINTSFHGLLFDVKEPTEIYIHPSDQIVVRSITTSGLKFHLFVGPNPEDIMKDVMKMIGYNKRLEYWMLGIHVCSEVPDIDLIDFMSNATREQMPFDSHCGHGPIVFNSNQCESNNISNIDVVNSGANIVKNAGKKFVPYVSPYIRYVEENANENNGTTIETAKMAGCEIINTYKNILYRHSRTLELYRGEVNDLEVVYPSYDQAPVDFLVDLWAYEEYAGVVLQNNWPLDTSDKLLNETAMYLPYFNENFAKAFENTPQWNLTLVNHSELYLFKHNVYGNNFAQSFVEKDNSTPIWASSLWMNGALAINRQNINASWTNLHRELTAAALGGISGHWLWSTPICGDTDNFNQTTQSNLCIKWYMAATYLPMVKIHSKIFLRHPIAFNGTQRSLVIGALNRRLGLLPYFYTTLQEGPLLRPMFYQYPSCVALHDINTQFSVGEILLIAPNLTPLQTHVHIWLPPGTWFELWSGLKLEGNEGDPVTMTTTEADFLTFIKDGSILIYQKGAYQTAEETRLSAPFSVIIALECNDNKTVCQASGKQFMTKELSLLFEANGNILNIAAVGNDFGPICDMAARIWTPVIENISVYGMKEENNNYDHHKEVRTSIDLCTLENNGQIVVNLLSGN